MQRGVAQHDRGRHGDAAGLLHSVEDDRAEQGWRMERLPSEDVIHEKPYGDDYCPDNARNDSLAHDIHPRPEQVFGKYRLAPEEIGEHDHRDEKDLERHDKDEERAEELRVTLGGFEQKCAHDADYCEDQEMGDRILTHQEPGRLTEDWLAYAV